MATIVGDVLGLQQRHHPKNIPHLIKKIKGFPLKVISFRNSATCQKLQGGLPPPPPPLNHDGGMNLRVRPRVNCDKAVSCAKKKKKNEKKLQGTIGRVENTPLVSCIFRRNSMMPLLILGKKRTALLLIQIMHVCLALILFASNLELLDQFKHKQESYNPKLMCLMCLMDTLLQV